MSKNDDTEKKITVTPNEFLEKIKKAKDYIKDERLKEATQVLDG